MRWRSEVMVAVSLVSAFAQPVVLLAQPGQPPAECACLLLPDKPHGPGVPNPGPPGVPETPGIPEIPGTPDSTSGSGSRRSWVYLGAAGVALLAGIPFAGSGVQALPFAPAMAGAPPGIAGAAPAPSSAAPSMGPVSAAEVPIVSRGDVVPIAPGTGEAGPLAAAAPAPGARRSVPALVRGLVPPKTATHLPLLGALGALLVGAGGLLARRTARERRRRRRFVAI